MKNEIKGISMKMYNKLLFLGICTKVSGSSVVPNRPERRDPTSPSRGGPHIPGDVVSRCRDTCREIHCDEYLRLRLRKSKAIRFNRRERRYARLRVSIFLDAYLTPGLLFPSKYADYSSASHVFVLHRAAIRYLAPERRKTEIYYFPTVTTCYLCPAV